MSARSDRLLLLRWSSLPTLEDVGKLRDTVAAARKAAGKPILFVSIVPASSAGMPPAEVRAEMNRDFPTLLASCECVHVAVEETGLNGSLTRTMLRGLTVASRNSARIVINATFEEALAALADKFGVDAKAARELARANKIAG